MESSLPFQSSLPFLQSQSSQSQPSEASKMFEQSDFANKNNEDSKFIEKLLVEILTQPSADKDRNVQRILHRVRCLEGVILGLEKALGQMEKRKV